MLTPAELEKVAAADAALARAAAEAEDAARFAMVATVAPSAESQYLAAWRERRDALISSDDFDHEGVLALVLDADAHGAGGRFPSILDGLWNLLTHPVDTIRGKLDPRTPSPSISTAPGAPAPALGSPEQRTPSASPSIFDQLLALLGDLTPWLAGLGILLALALVAYVVSVVAAPVRALRRA